jgi:uncharacterized protein
MSLIRFLTTALIVSTFAWTAGPLSAAEKKDKEKAEKDGPFKVLVFSKTQGFRHDCIETATAEVKKLGEANGFGVDATEDAGQFTVEVLKNYKVVMFLCTTGNVLDDTQQKVFEEYIRIGNGYVGVHSASDTEYDWPFYATLVGAYFKSHPAQQKAKVEVVDKNHPSTAHLPDVWERFDEWYNFRMPPTDVHVLLKIDEKSYMGGENGDNHPMCWYHSVDAGRAFYTELGHTKESYADPLYQKHLLGGIMYASGTLEKPAKDKKKKK